MNRPSAGAQRRRGFAEIVLQGLRFAARRFSSWAMAVRERGRTRQILSDLDDAALEDIGLTRNEIRGIGHDLRYRRRTSSS
jgi:uncharacterized protein YjiS (DUF1127 family)